MTAAQDRRHDEALPHLGATGASPGPGGSAAARPWAGSTVLDVVLAICDIVLAVCAVVLAASLRWTDGLLAWIVAVTAVACAVSVVRGRR